MGELVGLHCPTPLFANLADHTYVECGTGARGWGCWGRKQGGSELRRAAGSSLRANAIADLNERAGITCYLINGVCHQAANRILFPAGLTMDGVRGYKVSVAAFGPYGRPRGYFGGCKAPFNKHESISGDLPECRPSTGMMGTQGALAETSAVLDFEHQGYLARSRAIYNEAQELDTNQDDLFDYSMQQFGLFTDLMLGGTITDLKRGMLRKARADFEKQRMEAEAEYSQTDNLREFAEEFDRMTIELQHGFARALNDREYRRFLDTSPGQPIVISDPTIISSEPEPPPPNASFRR